MFTHRWSILFLAGLGCLASSRVCTPCAGARALDDPGWQARISADVVRSECAFRAVANEPGVWSAPNRSQDLRCRVSREGLEVFPRATNADGQRAAWTFGLRTSRFGRAGNDLALGSSATSATCNRVELEHGPLQEWFENGARGLEQGWTIAGRPAGDGPLRIGLELCGDVSARIESGARSLVLVDDAGDVKLRYRELEVFDARGRALDVRLEASASGVDVCIDDAGADYPLTVDPLLTGPAWMAESDQAGALFGHRVATAGDVNGDGYADVIVGAYTSDAGGYNSGCGYVFFGGPAMDATPDLVFPGEAAGDQLGYWVAGLGDVNGDGFGDVMIGASFNDAGAIDAGRAYLIDFNRYFVLAPNGGEVWTAGGFGAVTWTGGEPADVWVSGDDGATYQRVAMGVGGADTNRVLVNVPALPSDHARVRVTPTDTGVSGSDASDQAFRIVTPAGAPMSDAGALRFVAPCPNPATTTTRLVIDLPTAARVIVEAFDLSGRRVATPVAGELAPAGRFTRDWSLGALPEGVYRLRARVEDRELTRSLVRLASR